MEHGTEGDAAASRGWRTGLRRLIGDAAVVCGLAGVAVVQPLLDLFGQNPTFFVAGNYGRRKIVAFALVVTLVPAAVVFVATTLPGVLGRRVGAVAHGVGVALLAGVFGLVLCRTVGIDAAYAAVPLAVALGVAVAWTERSSRGVRRFLGYMAAGNVAFVALFTLASPTGRLLDGASYADGGAVTLPPLEGPVVVMVLDEFPLMSILRTDGTINDERYPNLAALAGESTWFRDAAAEIATTYVSVPSILSGRLASDDDLPTYRDHPRNLFTLFGASYPVRSYEPVTDLCPPETCGRPPGEGLTQALADATVVYGHRVLPDGLRGGLPAVDQGWGHFGSGVAGGAASTTTTASTAVSSTSSSAGSSGTRDGSSGESGTGEADPMARMAALSRSEVGRTGQAEILRRQVRLIGPEPSVNLVHVLLPHHPYELTPWGVSSSSTWLPAAMPDEDDPRYERAFADLHGLQAMQLGAVDQMVGETVAHLEAVGAWENCTFVLVSDHGIDTQAPHFNRQATEESQDRVLRVPLFVKAPGQTTGEVRDEPASTIDVLPTLIDVLDIEADWEMDGHSLLDGSEPTADRAITTSLDEALDRLALRPDHVPEGDDWTSLVAIGEEGDLVGTSVDEYRLGRPSALTWHVDHEEALADPAAAGGVAPVLLTGQVRGSDDTPPDLVVALDGVIAGTVGGYARDGDGWTFTGLLGPEVAGGADEVMAFEVERRGRVVTLRPLVP